MKAASRWWQAKQFSCVYGVLSVSVSFNSESTSNYFLSPMSDAGSSKHLFQIPGFCVYFYLLFLDSTFDSHVVRIDDIYRVKLQLHSEMPDQTEIDSLDRWTRLMRGTLEYSKKSENGKWGPQLTVICTDVKGSISPARRHCSYRRRHPREKT